MFTLRSSKRATYHIFHHGPEVLVLRNCRARLKELTDQGLLRVHFLLYSGSEHLDGRDVAASIVCDNKGYKELKADYKSITLCAAGYEKVDATTAFLNVTDHRVQIFSNETLFLLAIYPRMAIFVPWTAT